MRTYIHAYRVKQTEDRQTDRQTDTQTHRQTDGQILAYIQKYIHPYIHPYMTYIHTYIHTYMHTCRGVHDARVLFFQDAFFDGVHSFPACQSFESCSSWAQGVYLEPETPYGYVLAVREATPQLAPKAPIMRGRTACGTRPDLARFQVQGVGIRV